MYGINALFSHNKLRICLVRDSSSSESLDMDRFLNIKSEKPLSPCDAIFAPGKLTCVHGKPGTGKTTLVKQKLGHCLFLDPEIFKTRQGTLDMFERLRYSILPIVIDDWESVCDLIGIREISGAVSPKSPTVIIALTPIKISGATFHECRGIDYRREKLAIHSNSAPDEFESPKEYVHRLLRGEWKNVKLGDVTHEHGHVWSIVQENYPDRVNGDLNKLSRIADLMSDADIIDTRIYDQYDWGVIMPLFTIVSCIQPCQIMTPMNKVPRTGSLWTKYQNMCMRRKKLETMFRRTNTLTREALDSVIRLQFLKGDFSACKEYQLEPCDIDVLGHVIGPFKASVTNQAKKACSST